jgi:hypothetical protein
MKIKGLIVPQKEDLLIILIEKFETYFGTVEDTEITVKVSGDTIVTVEFPAKIKNMYYSMRDRQGFVQGIRS